MAVSRALKRLLRIRELEEEQSHLALESALCELRELEKALHGSAERGRLGRQLIAAGIETGELADRLAGLAEACAAARAAEWLAGRRPAAEREVEEQREEFLVSKTERRQAETLIDAVQMRDAIEAERKVQQRLDDWHRTRRKQAGNGPPD
jgi:hypothetical protein